MPRGLSRVDEAQIQRRLWTPAAVRGGLKCWLDFGYGRAIGISSGDITTVSDPTASVGWARVSDGPTWSLTAVNNLPGATFTLSPHERVLSDTYVAVTLPLVASAIMRMDSGSGNFARMFAWASSTGSDSGSTNGLSCMIRWNGTDAITTYFNGVQRAITSVTLGSIMIFSVYIDGSGNIAHFLNGGAGDTSTLGATPTWSAVRFMSGCQDVTGSSGSGNAPYNGRFGEGLVYCGNDAVILRPYFEGYLAHKWRHTATMAGTHRFKSAPPLIGA